MSPSMKFDVRKQRWRSGAMPRSNPCSAEENVQRSYPNPLRRALDRDERVVAVPEDCDWQVAGRLIPASQLVRPSGCWIKKSATTAITWMRCIDLAALGGSSVCCRRYTELPRWRVCHEPERSPGLCVSAWHWKPDLDSPWQASAASVALIVGLDPPQYMALL